MTKAMITDFKQKASTLSYEDTLYVISLLLENLKEMHPEAKEKSSDFFNDFFALADSSPELHKSDKKWSRDELHRY